MRRSAAVVVVVMLLGGSLACRSATHSEAAQLTGGDPDRGVATIGRYGCAACHTIPGIRGASALVGPSLDRIASRAYLAGRIENTPANMVRWIQHPQKVEPGTVMPEMGVTEADARDIAAYLYTLR
jgi:cytochrome c